MTERGRDLTKSTLTLGTLGVIALGMLTIFAFAGSYIDGRIEAHSDWIDERVNAKVQVKEELFRQTAETQTSSITKLEKSVDEIGKNQSKMLQTLARIETQLEMRGDGR